LAALYITSVGRRSGKALTAIGLMDRARRDGLKVSYFKPMGHFPVKVQDTVADKGALLIHRLFELEDPLELVCPVVITRDMVMENYKGKVTGLEEKVLSAFKRLSEQKDLIVVGCDNNFGEGSSFGLSGLRLMELLNARALFVERYECGFCVDFLLEFKNIVGKPMIGVVFNKVEAIHLGEIEEFVSPFLQRGEIEVFGSLPNDPFLGAVEVKELAEHLAADVICGRDGLNTYVETFLVGGMQVDKFISYLAKSTGAAVIVGGDRTDIQLVAIENKVRCLILSGNLYPSETIIARAEVKGVPILVAREDTYSVARKVEGTAGSLSTSRREKVDHGIKLIDQTLDFKNLYERLELRPL
jgi:BioD-like phosphotransacetylase family protein